MTLSDETIVREVLCALRSIDDGTASIALAGNALMLRLLGERPMLAEVLAIEAGESATGGGSSSQCLLVAEPAPEPPPILAVVEALDAEDPADMGLNVGTAT